MRKSTDNSRELELIENNRKDVILKIKPMTEDAARNWLGAANQSGDEELINHFAEAVKRLSE